MILMYFPFKSSAALYSSRWYFGKIKRIEAEKKLLLQQNEHGAFLIRDSESRRNDFSLSVRDGDTVKHYRIRWQMFAILTYWDEKLFFFGKYSDSFMLIQILRTCSYQATGRWWLLHCSSHNVQKSARAGRQCSSFVFCYKRSKIFKLMLISSSPRWSTTHGTQMAFASTWENPASRWFSNHLIPFSTNSNNRPLSFQFEAWWNLEFCLEA